MAFSNNDSVVASDLNNMRRGLYRDNTDHAVTGTTNETDMASLTITGGTIGATGRITFEAAGTITGAAGTKRLRLYFGTFVIYDSTAVTGTTDWFIRGSISNTATGTQRGLLFWRDHQSATSFNADYVTSSIDTTANVTFKLSAQLGSAADTVTQTRFEVEVQQIT